MDTFLIDGRLLKKMVTNGAIQLRNNIDRINELNVFPVPDGDTGSNMSATMTAGAKAVAASDEAAIGVVAKAIARGMLMGARGNSGVILSQLFSGLANGLKGLAEADTCTFSHALRNGVEQAYAAVINPVEGTMLTVAREGADRALSLCPTTNRFETLFDSYMVELEASLERTPDLLPILKEVGVIDSGGAGYIEIVRGMLDALKGKTLADAVDAAQKAPGHVAGEAPRPQSVLNHEAFKDDGNYGYCTEFIMQIAKVDEFSQKDFVEMISPLGNSLVCVQDDNILKVHIHTETPGDVLNLGQRFGFFINLKIENMTVQHTEVVMHEPTHAEGTSGEPCDCGHDHTPRVTPRVHKKYAIVAVVNGDGLKETFIEMGCDFIIEGGQTMNPSIEDFVQACDAIDADSVIIIPNNKNVLLSAETAAKIIENKKVYVLPAKTIAQGYASLTMFDATQDAEKNLTDMKNHIMHVKTGEVTYAIRDSVNNGVQIRKNDFIGIHDGEIVSCAQDRLAVATAMMERMLDPKSEIVTVMYGADVQDAEVDVLVKAIEDLSSAEVETIAGGQEIYSYIVSVE
ncbi:MAG: DAK2 domain-containing protein [Candidatus Izemoplasmatales bacterium]